MAINASPMYQKAEEQFRSATNPQDKLAPLEEVCRLALKHKVGVKLQSHVNQDFKSVREQIERSLTAYIATNGRFELRTDTWEISFKSGADS